MSDCDFDISTGLKFGPDIPVEVPINGEYTRLVNGKNRARGDSVHVRELSKLVESGALTQNLSGRAGRDPALEGFIMGRVTLPSGRRVELPMRLDSIGTGKARDDFAQVLKWVRDEWDFDTSVERELLEVTVSRLPARRASESAGYVRDVTTALMGHVTANPRLFTAEYLEAHPALAYHQRDALVEMCKSGSGHLIVDDLAHATKSWSEYPQGRPAPLYAAHVLRAYAASIFTQDWGKAVELQEIAARADRAAIAERFPKLSEEEVRSVQSWGFTGVHAQEIKDLDGDPEELVAAAQAHMQMSNAQWDRQPRDPMGRTRPDDPYPTLPEARAEAYMEARRSARSPQVARYVAAMVNNDSQTAAYDLSQMLREGCSLDDLRAAQFAQAKFTADDLSSDHRYDPERAFALAAARVAEAAPRGRRTPFKDCTVLRTDEGAIWVRLPGEDGRNPCVVRFPDADAPKRRWPLSRPVEPEVFFSDISISEMFGDRAELLVDGLSSSEHRDLGVVVDLR